MKTLSVASRLLPAFVLGSLLALFAGGCQNANLGGGGNAGVRIPGPHNTLVVINTYSPGSAGANSWHGLSPTLIINLPTTEDGYPSNLLGLHTALKYDLQEEPHSSEKIPGPHNRTAMIPGPHNIVLIRMMPGALKTGAKPLSSPPQVYVHLTADPSDPAPDYHARKAPFVVINLPEYFHQGTPDQPAEYPETPHP